MSKAQEALESLMADYYEMCQDLGSNDDQYQRWNLTSERATIAKALNVLEIIKNNDIDFKILKEAFAFNGSNKEQCEMYNVNQWQWVFDLAHPGCVNPNRYKRLTQDEYDLLKEVLL